MSRVFFRLLEASAAQEAGEGGSSLLTEDMINKDQPLYNTMHSLYIRKERRLLLEGQEAGPSGCFGPCMRA